MNAAFETVLNDIKSSAKKTEILPSILSVKEELHRTYTVHPDSLHGMLLENTGGIIIERWLRFYGTGELNFIARNRLIPFDNIVVAEDILGGLFMCMENGHIGYFAPDCLELEDMEIGFGSFFGWCLHGDTDTFYKDYRWKHWQEELSDLDYDSGIAFYPFLWAEAKTLEHRKRTVVPMAELIGLEFDFLRQFG